MNLFKSNCQTTVAFKDEDSRNKVTLESNGEKKELLLFGSGDPVEGTVTINPNGSKINYTSIRVELIGQIELSYDRGAHYVFCTQHQDVEASAGTLDQAKDYTFSFVKSDKQFESYSGINANLRYFIRVKISRNYATNIKKEFDFAVQCVDSEPESNPVLKMEVGIEDCLHIEFEYDKSCYTLNEIIKGTINFLLVRIKIQKMELQIIKRESTGSGPNLYNETEIITKYEIMDGAPVKDEQIPIRLFLKPFNLTPTYRTVQSKFSVRYYLNLVLVDEEERRYFKQQEITLWRHKMSETETGDYATSG